MKSRMRSPLLTSVAMALFVGMSAGLLVTSTSPPLAQGATAPPTFADQFRQLQQQVAALQAQVNALQASADCSTVKSCNGKCTDVSQDPNNCGACGTVCPAGDICKAGTCVAQCAAGQTLCGSTCVNITNDASNCGACGTVCPSGQTCTMGTCVLTCAAGTTNCAGTCVDLNSDPKNCGKCGTVCPSGQACTMGLCTQTCAAGTTLCAGTCVDLQTDPANCGGCGAICPSGQTCTNGACAPQACTTDASCGSGQRCCAGTCLNTSSDTNNCGACGNHCSTQNATAACTSGACTIGSCNTGFADCNKNAADGCEVNLTTDANNCGGCGVSCGANGQCQSGACVSSCNPGQTLCNGTCINTASDPSNCGACGTVCSTPNGIAKCVSGACAVGGCNAGFRDCNGLASDGCETNINSDTNNCGACGVRCTVANGTATCSSGACAVGTCNAGFANCDGQAANGCETNINTDPHNCGACGVQCAVGKTCNGGACGVASGVASDGETTRPPTP